MQFYLMKKSGIFGEEWAKHGIMKHTTCTHNDIVGAE